MSQIEKGCLYIVATPIGNLGDITYRAEETLKGVDAIAAEDTRHSKKLLQHLGIDTPMFALHEHNEKQKTESIIQRIKLGEAIALISDAGTPLISDPGFTLVRDARKSGIKVIPVPGASSILAALTCSGLPTDRFAFEGFLPSKKGSRKKLLLSLERESRTTVYFEAPHRLIESLKDCSEIMGGNRNAVLCRELTKTWETFIYGSLNEIVEKVSADANQCKGEIVIIISGYKQEMEIDNDVLKMLDLLLEVLPLKKAATLTAKYFGINKNTVYQAGVERKNRSQ
ncbi:MAG: 16S rRNA (cytidine(1402)-2'-O)-methyltransferase [Gammaproteobacteria bacterium]|nr:16S rRNA (cytidine(1402)-2'-O)-methyltransferase [Gammaproteobacteria bacterium]